MIGAWPNTMAKTNPSSTACSARGAAPPGQASPASSGGARSGGDPVLQCQAGSLARSELQRRAAAYAAGFGFDRFRESFCASLASLEAAT